MHIRLLAIGTRMPSWVNEGFETYARRLLPECRLLLKEVATATQSSPQQTRRVESGRLLAALNPGDRLMALDQRGKSLTSEQLAEQLDRWLQDARNPALLVGGAEGLDETVRQKAEFLWSLSPLTLPHPLVRVVVAEQLYRAQCILHRHPYHRQ